jgi:large-conductance mechanosensitive channel
MKKNPGNIIGIAIGVAIGAAMDSIQKKKPT